MSFNSLDQPKLQIIYKYGEIAPDFHMQEGKSSTIERRYIERIIVDGQPLPINDHLFIVEGSKWGYVEREFPDIDKTHYILFVPVENITLDDCNFLKWIFHKDFDCKIRNGLSIDNYMSIVENKDNAILSYRCLIQLFRNMAEEFGAICRLKEWAADKNNVLYDMAAEEVFRTKTQLLKNFSRLLGFADKQKLPRFSTLVNNGLYKEDLSDAISNDPNVHQYAQSELLEEISLLLDKAVFEKFSA